MSNDKRRVIVEVQDGFLVAIHRNSRPIYADKIYSLSDLPSADELIAAHDHLKEQYDKVHKDRVRLLEENESLKQDVARLKDCIDMLDKIN